MKNVTVNCSDTVGAIKPMHGVGGGPVTMNFTFDATEYFRKAHIPFCRTHDIEYPLGAGEYVDIHCIFPNFDADVEDPKSYNFVFTDEYLKAIVAAGAKPFYRLGSTIEHQPIKRYIHPPKDNEKWAKICSHIISHYNEGWADGFHMGIEYWEIWNEPDLTNRCWTGSAIQFFELYVTAAKLLKAEHPDVKIGGCAITSPYSGMAEPFLKYISESGAPLDFFSWHNYIHTPKQAKDSAERAEVLLKKYGFDSAESIYDEWNYVVAWDDTIQRSIDLHKTPMCAAFVSSVMSVLQDTRTDKSMYYDVQMPGFNWNGVFTPGRMKSHGEPMPIILEKPFYALEAFGKLYELGTQVKTEVTGEDLFVTGAKNGNVLRLLVTQYNDDGGFGESAPAKSGIVLDFGSAKIKKLTVRKVDEDHAFEEEALTENSLELVGNSFALVEAELA